MGIRDLVTNPPSPKDLLLGIDRFSCRGNEYPYSEVKSVRFYAAQISHYRNLDTIPYTTTNVTEFDIHLRISPKPIRIRPEASAVERLFIGHSHDQQEHIRSVYHEFRGKTFLSRLEDYLITRSQYGCLVYDDKRFFPDGRVTDGTRTFDLHAEAKNGKLRRELFKLYIELPKSFVGNVAHRLAQKDIGLPWIKERNFVISTEYARSWV